MNRTKVFFLAAFACLLAMCFVMVSCDMATGKGGEESIPAVYKDFYNYPTGRVDPTGTLTVQNMVASKTLLFNGTVEGSNFLGIVDSLSSVKLKLPEEKAYTIVAVDARNYEERTTQAEQTSTRTFYSNIIPYRASVSAQGSFGKGIWRFYNNTNYWVIFRSGDQAIDYAAVPPDAQGFSIPIEENKSYIYQVIFSKEISYNGKIIALLETNDKASSDIAIAKKENNYIFETVIGGEKENSIKSTGSLKPCVLIKNNSGKTIWPYKDKIRLSNGANVDGDGLSIVSGESQLFVGSNDENIVVGFADTDNVNLINFYSPAWEDRISVTQDIIMEAGKIYSVSLTKELTTEVEVIDAEEYFNENK